MIEAPASTAAATILEHKPDGVFLSNGPGDPEGVVGATQMIDGLLGEVPVFGICYGGEMVGFPIINRKLFGANAPLGSIYSFQMVGASTGMALGGWLGGALFDTSGAYTTAILVAAGIGQAALAFELGSSDDPLGYTVWLRK